jgi:ribosome-associated translation inhibitor RaiA
MPINEALRQHMEEKAPKVDETLRRIVRVEMKAAG